MTNQTIHLRGRALVSSLLALVLLVFAGGALAAPATTTLDQVSHQELPGGRVEIDLVFTGGAVPQPKIFTTTQPPRIAVDFAGTANGVSRKHMDVGVGATSGLSVVSAGGRTRLVVDLLRPASYRTEIDGQTLKLIIANGEGATTGTVAATIDPTKVLPASTGSAEISRIGFRRGQNGTGRVLIDFSGSGLQSRIQTEDGKVVVHLDDVSVPQNLAKRLDVMDFATPVQTIDTKPGSVGGGTITLDVDGPVVTSSYKANHKLVIEVAKKVEKKNPDEMGGVKKKAYTGSRVTFNFQNIPVRAALQLIAQYSHLNLVAADSVQGSVTLNLDNVPWDQALDVILRAKGLDKRRNGNVIWVAPQQELANYEQDLAQARLKAANSAPLVAAYIPISYGKAKDIAQLLSSGSRGGGNGGGHGFLSPRGSVTFDVRTNTLLINDTPDKIKEIKNLVARLDRPVQQVLIEARIVAATDSFARDLGVRWGVQGWQTSDSGKNRFVTGPTANTAGQEGIDLHNGDPVTMQLGDGGYNVNLPIASPAGSAALAILGANYLVDLELQAAQTEGRTEIISSPRVITANQQEADIQQGQQIGYVTVQGGTQGGTAIPTVQFKNAVLELKVTPTITADKRVFLKINVTKDALDKFIANPGGGQVPLLNHRSINTSVLVDNGQTVVLGGIYEINKSNNVTKVPGLGDIPILGALFRKTEKSNAKAELLIFVTPRILTETTR
ncbi:MAG TPA: type IV pilus secretin PilQ [Rhodanobacteraceae bacterium]|nr:type IV pilus secretin PilQ [Rhodanobacteraceae bacterium]